MYTIRDGVSVYCDFTSDEGGWTKVLQYVVSYTPTANAIDDIAVPSASSAAKLSDANIVAIAGANPTWRFIDEGAVAGSYSKLFLRSTGTFSDVARSWGFPANSNYQLCLNSALSNCGWGSPSTEGVAHGYIETIDTTGNNCNRWFADLVSGSCYSLLISGDESTSRCFSHGNDACGNAGDKHAPRQNVALWVRPQ